MPAVQEMTERHTRLLERVAELSLSLAEKMHGLAMEAETPEAAAGYGLSFQRAARAVRQTVALEARLQRDLQRQEKDDAAETRRAAEARIDHRKAQVKAKIGLLIWNEDEYEDSESLDLDAKLDDRLDAEAFGDHFTDEPLEAQIARLCAELGVETPQEEDTAEHPASDADAHPAPPVNSAGQDPQAPASDDDWRSSA